MKFVYEINDKIIELDPTIKEMQDALAMVLMERFTSHAKRKNFEFDKKTASKFADVVVDFLDLDCDYDLIEELHDELKDYLYPIAEDSYYRILDDEMEEDYERRIQ